MVQKVFDKKAGPIAIKASKVGAYINANSRISQTSG